MQYINKPTAIAWDDEDTVPEERRQSAAANLKRLAIERAERAAGHPELPLLWGAR